jgi:uncharacterized protein (DUF1499 family)
MELDKLDSRVIEFTNKVEFKIGLDKEFKELYTTFKNVQANLGLCGKRMHTFLVYKCLHQ